MATDADHVCSCPRRFALTGDTPEAGSHRPDGAHWPSCRTCGEDWPCSAATHAAGVRVTGDAGLDVERLNTAILDELVALWGEPSDAVSTQVRPIVARNIAARYAALTGDTPEAPK